MSTLIDMVALQGEEVKLLPTAHYDGRVYTALSFSVTFWFKCSKVEVKEARKYLYTLVRKDLRAMDIFRDYIISIDMPEVFFSKKMQFTVSCTALLRNPLATKKEIKPIVRDILKCAQEWYDSTAKEFGLVKTERKVPRKNITGEKKKYIPNIKRVYAAYDENGNPIATSQTVRDIAKQIHIDYCHLKGMNDGEERKYKGMTIKFSKELIK